MAMVKHYFFYGLNLT